MVGNNKIGGIFYLTTEHTFHIIANECSGIGIWKRNGGNQAKEDAVMKVDLLKHNQKTYEKIKLVIADDENAHKLCTSDN